MSDTKLILAGLVGICVGIPVSQALWRLVLRPILDYLERKEDEKFDRLCDEVFDDEDWEG
jgi:hypothetical protein